MRLGRRISFSTESHGGHAIKNLAVVDDATHEAVAVVPEHNISSRQLVRILEQICAHRRYLKSYAPITAKNFAVGQC